MESHYVCDRANGRVVFTNKKTFSFIVVFTPSFGDIKNSDVVHVVKIKPLALPFMPNAQKIINGTYIEVMNILGTHPELFRVFKVKGDISLYSQMQKLIPAWTYRKFQTCFKFDLDNEDFMHIGRAKIICPFKFSKSKKLAVRFAIEETLTKLSNSGFESITDCIITIGRLHQTIGGIYHINDDEMTINVNLIDKPDVMKRTICHEHGHRHYYLMLNEEDRQILAFQFSEFKSIGSHVLSQDIRYITTLKANEVVVYSGKVRKHMGIWRIDTTCSERGFIKLRNVDRPEWLLNETYTTFHDHGFRFEDHDIRFGDYIPSIASMIEPTKSFDIWFPSLYSATSVEEWYAEGITLLPFNQLKGEIKTFFERFIK